jgi:hypothetical protein
MEGVISDLGGEPWFRFLFLTTDDAELFNFSISNSVYDFNSAGFSSE